MRRGAVVAIVALLSAVGLVVWWGSPRSATPIQGATGEKAAPAKTTGRGKGAERWDLSRVLHAICRRVPG